MRLQSLRFLLAAAAIGVSACSIDKVDGPEPVTDATQVEFAPSLQVDLDAMTRTSSGLYVQDVVPGTGAAVVQGDSITVRYTGWLSNGRKFDSSADHGTGVFGATVAPGRLIDGWVEGMVGMKAGGKRRLVVPPGLGYGARGYGPIPGFAVLVFDIELLAVN